MHNPELAAEFGRVIMEGMGAEAFTTPTIEDNATVVEPFGTDLTEAHPSHIDGDADMSTIVAKDEWSYKWGLSVDAG